MMRSLVRNPGFAATAVLTLALGIGASCVVWTAVRAVLIDLPPVTAAEELRVIDRTLIEASGARADGSFLSYPVYTALREQLAGVGRLAAYTAQPRSFNLASGAAEASRLPLELVAGDYLDVLGVPVAYGRPLASSDDVEGAAPVLVLGHAAARALYGEPAAAVGATLRVDGHAFEVVGVTPAGFAGLSQRAAGFVPMAQAPRLTFARRLVGALSFWHQAVLRPVPGATAAALDARLQVAGGVVAERFGGDRIVGFEFRVLDLRAARDDGSTTRTLLVLAGGVIALLLLACANAANLLLVRGVARATEQATRLALGADRGRLVRAALLEGALLTLAAALLALPLAGATLWLLARAAPGLALGAVPLDALALDASTAAFAIGVALVCVLLAALGPALGAARQAERVGLAAALRGPRAGAALRRCLILFEAAAATLLLVGAGLMLRSAWNLQHEPLGFVPDQVLVAELGMPRANYKGAQADAFLAATLERAAALPGVATAAFAYCPPPDGACDQIVARTADQAEHHVVLNQVSQGYFDALSVPLLAGRGFGPADGAGGAPVVVLAERAARELFGSTQAALGARLALGVGWPEQGATAEVVGVVGDLRDAGLAAPPRPLVYVDWRQLSYGEGRFLLRGAQPAALARPLAAVVRAQDPEVVVWDARSMTERISAAIARERLVATLLLAFGAIALLLAATGVAAVLGLAVEQRRREFGIRLAVGARPRDLLAAVLGDGVATVLAGAALGLVAAQLLSGALAALLHGVAPLDPTVRVAALAAIAVAGALGALLPAWRAARTEPTTVLRHE